ncbi:MAG: hypothetical protein WDN06_11015 [Asticcacaulis sp.]
MTRSPSRVVTVWRLPLVATPSTVVSTKRTVSGQAARTEASHRWWWAPRVGQAGPAFGIGTCGPACLLETGQGAQVFEQGDLFDAKLFVTKDGLGIAARIEDDDLVALAGRGPGRAANRPCRRR